MNPRRKHVLVVRLDRLGDMLVCGPAIRAVAAAADHVTVLASPHGAEAARLLPGVDDVLVWDCPWIGAPPAAVERGDVLAVADRIAAAGVDEALVLTSFHQTALPTALVLRMAGVPRVAAVSQDYPGSLLDARLADPPDAPEPERMREIARAAGYPAPLGDRGLLTIRTETAAPAGLPGEPYVVVHPGADAPARAYPASCWAAAVASLTHAGRTVVVTGSPGERALAESICAAVDRQGQVLDLSGRTDVSGLASVLRNADVLVTGNTGPAHLAAAVGTPVVSLFAPVVSAVRWAPFGVPVHLLGDQHAACRDTRARVCPVPGHPCLSRIDAAEIVTAVDALARVAAPEVAS